MFKEWLPSEYAVAVLFVTMITSLVSIIISGIVCKVRTNKGEDISKTKMGKLLCISLVLFVISMAFIIVFYALSEGNSRIARPVIRVSSLVLIGIIFGKSKHKVRNILIAILVIGIIMGLPAVFLSWDEGIRSERYYNELNRGMDI